MGIIYLTKNQCLEIDTEDLSQTVRVNVNEYVKELIMYKSKDGKQIITNLITKEL